MEVLSLCPFRAGALAWQSAPNAWSLTVVVKATFSIVVGGEAIVAPLQTPVTAFAGDAEAIEDLSPLKPKVDVLVVRGGNNDTATVEIASCVLPARGPVPPYAPARRILLQDQALEWAAAVLRGEALGAGPAPEGFDFAFFHVAPREQRLDLLRTGVPLVLNNILPHHKRAETILPQRKPQAFRIHPQTGKASEIILRCDTLCIDAGRGVLVLTFRGIADLDAQNPSNAGTIVVASHSAGKKIRADRIERFLRNGEPIEGESQDGRHPLEKRYDTVIAAPKGDTVALPEMDHASSGVWQAAPMAPNDSGIMPAAGLPFQPPPVDAPSHLAPPGHFHAPGGGRRLGTLATSGDTIRTTDMPFQSAAPRPPDVVFHGQSAMISGQLPSEPAPLLRPPPMFGGSFARDEKTADLPPGHESPEETTIDLQPEVAAVTLRLEAPAPVSPLPHATPSGSSLAGNPAPAAHQPPEPPKAVTILGAGPEIKPPAMVAPPPAAPAPPMPAPEPPKAVTILGAGPEIKPPAMVAPAPTAPKPAPATPATPKPGSAPIAPKPVATSSPVAKLGSPTTASAKPAAPAVVAPKPTAPKAPIKAPAPLGPKLKGDVPAKPAAATPATVEKKPAPASPPEKPAAVVVPDKPAVVAPAKPASVGADKQVAPAKPNPVALRPMVATVPFPSAIKPMTAAAAPVALAASDKPATNTPAEEPFNPAESLKLEECAALEAEIRHRLPTRNTLLDKNDLSEKQWATLQKYWSDAIARETEVGERKLLVAHDAAYFAVQEKLGIPVGLETYAKLQVAAERGTSAEVLKELGLEPADQMRLGRVWTRRLADEPARMRELAAAIEKARAG